MNDPEPTPLPVAVASTALLDDAQRHLEAGGCHLEPFKTTRILTALIAELREYRDGMKEAHKIISVLHMDALDHNAEMWPRAQEWQHSWEFLSI